MWGRVAAAAVPTVLIVGALILWLFNRSAAEVPSAQPAVAISPGRLIVDAEPWAEIVRVLDSEGEEMALPPDPYTPLALTLPPGRYWIELTHPDLGGETRQCEAEVAEEAAGECRLRLIEVEAREFLREAGWS